MSESLIAVVVIFLIPTDVIITFCGDHCKYFFKIESSALVKSYGNEIAIIFFARETREIR